MREAARLLDAELFLAGVPDGELADTPAARKELIETYRRFQATLILAHTAEDYHPDHRAASALAESASWFCASKGHQTGSPALPAPPALWWMDTVQMIGFQPTFYVDISRYITVKERMLSCHWSQLARGTEKDFSPLLTLMRQQAQTRGTQCGVAAAEAFRPHRAFKRARAW
jgi:LmbE family N-acetylglucosaminyl deacetylase